MQFFKKRPEFYCLDCGTIGKAKVSNRGSILIELILWFFLLIPGLIYSVWRHGELEKRCKKCGSMNIIPEDSPNAIKLINEEDNIL